MIAAAPLGWILLDTADFKRYRVIAWVCTEGGISPAVLQDSGSIGVIPEWEATHQLYYDPETFGRL